MDVTIVDGDLLKQDVDVIAIAKQRGYRSVAIPLIGAGSGGGKPARIQSIIEDELTRCDFDGEVRIVRYRR